MNTQTLTATITEKCCIWCGYGNHYTDEVFTLNGSQVAHCSKGCEHDATNFTSEQTRDESAKYRHNKGECADNDCTNYELA